MIKMTIRNDILRGRHITGYNLQDNIDINLAKTQKSVNVKPMWFYTMYIHYKRYKKY